MEMKVTGPGTVTFWWKVSSEYGDYLEFYVDQPVCMIEGAATSYYHFDALGSVVALSNAAGNTIQVYEYSVWGQVGASDPNHTNPYMFTARRFDKETGLYYYRARYYNPEIGRSLQTDPVGYEAGMNLYRYCNNNPLNVTDPYGRDPCDPCDSCDSSDPYTCDVCNDSNGPTYSEGARVQSNNDTEKDTDRQYWEKAGYKSLNACIADKLVLCGSVWSAIGGAGASSLSLYSKAALVAKIAGVVSAAYAVYCAGEVFGAWCRCTAPASRFPELD